MERVKEAASSEGPHGRDQHIHIGILCKGLVASLCNHTSEVVLCLASTCVAGFKVLRNFYANYGESVQHLQSVKLTG